jgi:O-methyltransferase
VKSSNAVKSTINGVLGRYGLEIRSRDAGARVAVEASAADVAIMDACRSFTMTGAERLWALIQAVHYVNQNGTPGDLVECGVWRGGSAMAMAMTDLCHEGSSRRLWLYDTFQGMTAPSRVDFEFHSGRSAEDLLERTAKSDGNNVWAVASLEDVQANMRQTGFPDERIEFRQGDVACTLLDALPTQVALLRLDTDWYESTRMELEVLYPLVAVGGVIIIDDYGHWAGARQAVDEYLRQQDLRPLIHRIDYSGRMWLKQ